MKTALVASLIGNVVLLIGAGLVVSMQSRETRQLAHEAEKWKQAAIKSYRLRVITDGADANIIGRVAAELPNYCRSAPYLMTQMILLHRLSTGIYNIVEQVNAKLNEGDLKEPLDDAIWKEK